MKLPAFFKCSECKSLLLLSDEERVSKEFKCPECGHTFDRSISELHLSTIAATFSGTDVFTVRHRENEIQVVYLPNKEIIVLYNGDVIVRTPIGSKVFGEKHELRFTVKEHNQDRTYQVKIHCSHGTTYDLYCRIYRQGKLIYGQESTSSKVAGYLIGGFIVVIILLYFLSQ